MTTPSKPEILDALRARVDSRRALLHESQRTTQSGATHEEARPEHAKDTRATEAAYLARGLAQRVSELDEVAERLSALELVDFGAEDAIALTALVALEDEDGERSLCFLVPVGGGETLELGGVRIQPVTPSSPLGRALLGARSGDDLELTRPSGSQSLQVRWVR